MTALALRPLSGGEILDASFQLYRRHFRSLLLLGLVAFVPMGLAYVVIGIPVGALEEGAAAGASVVLLVVSMLALGVAWGALIHGVEEASRGEEVQLGKGLGVGLRRLPAFALLFVAAYLLLFAGMLPVGVAAALVAGGASVLDGALGIVTVVLAAVVGVIALGTFLVWWMAMIFLGPSALILEGVGPLQALGRGRTLSKGARMRITVLGSVAWTIAVLPTFAVLLVLGLGSTMWNPAAASNLSGTELILQQFAMLGVSALTTPFVSAVYVVLYLDRRVRVEGYDVEVASAAISAAP